MTSGIPVKAASRVAAILAAAAAAVLPAAAAPPPGTASFRSGVYTKEQADRGFRIFIRNCSACHGEMFNGSESGPELSDDQFLSHWKDRTLADLYNKMNKTMPPLPDQPGRLSPQEYTDIIAAILKVNEVHEGKSELQPNIDALGHIEMQ